MKKLLFIILFLTGCVLDNPKPPEVKNEKPIIQPSYPTNCADQCKPQKFTGWYLGYKGKWLCVCQY